MKKVLSIARAEYMQAVFSKAFIIGVLLMPVMLSGSIAVQVLFEDQVDLRDRICVVVDPTGELWPVLERAAEERNEEAIWETGEDGTRDQLRPRFVLESFTPGDGERADVALSERVEDGELQGFLVIGDTVLGDEGEVGERPIAYHTNEPTFTELPSWFESVVNDELRRRRFDAAEIDRELVTQLNRHVPLSTWGLVNLRDDGTVDEAEREQEIRTFGIPVGGMMLLFMLIMTSAPQLMNQVLEEKMQRISEVLLSAVTPFQLMLGKLVGSTAITLTLAAIYLGGVAWATSYWGVSDWVPPSAYAWFLLMMLFAVLMYGSLFSALGSACSELRDAQSMMMPAMIMVLIPLFALGAIVESPNSTLAQVMTFVPTATPMILLVRVLAPPGPPLVEVVLALLACLASTLVLVWASAKIFRIGVLSQGQTPSFKKLLGWVTSK